MSKYRVFLSGEAMIGESSLILDARESHHLVRVLRAREGEALLALDGAGGRFWGRIEGAEAKRVLVKVERVERERPLVPRVRLLQALPKGKTMDLILRMATEIGATSVQPLFTEHSEVQLAGQRLEGKESKWRLTMIESCKQCGVAFLPELCPSTTLRDCLSGRRFDGDKEVGIVASLEAGSRPLWETLASFQSSGAVESLSVAVGPEGDFSAEEYGLLHDAGFLPVRLGRNILRAETAAAYILSVVDQQLLRGVQNLAD